MKDKAIRIAIAGVGNCAQALLSGIEYYRLNPDDSRGLMNVDVGGYKVTDIVPVAAFDINAGKVGKDLSEAMFAHPNRAYRYPGVTIPPYHVTVMRGPTFDGNTPALAEFVAESDAKPVDVVQVLKDSGAEILINIIPTESHEAARFYADAAIKQAKIGMMNMMPTNIACNPEYQQAAVASGVPIYGDDGKSQLGGSILHRALASAMVMRGIHIDEMYQINYAGNTDFMNLMTRGKSKHKTKQETVTSLVPYPVTMSTGFTFVEMMKDRKTSVIYINAGNFGNAPLHVETRLEVEDSANLGGIMVEIIRHMRLALDRKVSGVLESSCAFFAKHPPIQMPDETALEHVNEFIARQAGALGVDSPARLGLVCVGRIVREMIYFPNEVKGPVLGSPPAYCTVAAARQGTATGIVTKIGPDMPAHLLQPIVDAGVDTSGIIRAERSTASELIYDAQGNKEIRYPSMAPPIKGSEIPSAFAGCGMLYVCTMDDDVLPDDMAEVVAKGQQSAIDLGGYGGAHMSRQHRQAVPSLVRYAQDVSSHFDLVRASAEDAAIIFGWNQVEEAAKRLLDCGPTLVVITLGADGVLLCSATDQTRVPAVPGSPVDTTGGGDTFMAGFLSEYLRSGDPVRSAQWGCATAMCVIEQTGGVRVERMPTRDQVQMRVSQAYL